MDNVLISFYQKRFLQLGFEKEDIEWLNLDDWLHLPLENNSFRRAVYLALLRDKIKERRERYEDDQKTNNIL